MAQCVAVQYRWLMQKGHGRAVRHARVGIDRRRTRAQVVQPTTSHHRGLSRVGRRKPELADGLSLSPLAVGPTQILMTRRTEAHVERARAAEHEFSPHGGL